MAPSPRGVLLLLVLVAQAWSKTGKGTAEPEPSSGAVALVPVPTNVTIESYNLNPVLRWDYQDMVPTPLFTVEIKTYRQAIWIEACTNISHHHCNIHQEIDPSVPFWARVKARVGQRESAYVESNEFIICSQGKYGPPILNVTSKEKEIIVDVYHPFFIINETEELPNDYEDVCYDFTYNVYIRSNESEFPKQQTRDCFMSPCQLVIPVPSLNAEYCVSAQGFAEYWEIKTEKSEENCYVFTTISDNSTNSPWIPVVSAVLFFIVLISIFIFCMIKKINPFKRENITLPKSLLSVVKHATSETKPESKYVSLITSYQSMNLDSEKVVNEEPLCPAVVPGMHTEGNAEKVEPTEDDSSQTEVVTIEENVSDVLAGSPLMPVRRENSSQSSSNHSEPCSSTLNLYHSRNGSDSGLVRSDSFVSDSEFPTKNKTEIQDSVMAIRNTTTSFGYDKPHVLVDLLVDGDGKESLIGYRLPADSKELS